MATNLSITSDADQARVLQCPNCKETINTSQHQCPFCSACIDSRTAEVGADLMAEVNQACSDASDLRLMAGLIFTCFALRVVPFFGGVGFWSYFFFFIAVPVMAVRWWLRFGRLRTDEADFHRAKRTIRIAVGIWSIFLVLEIIFGIILRIGSKP